MQTKIKTIAHFDIEQFDNAVNLFTKDKQVIATQTHVTWNQINGTSLYTAVIYYKE
jgi:hypothetical protein